MASHAIEISLQHFPPFFIQEECKKPSYPISDYLQSMLTQYGIQEGEIISLPSLMKLAQFFRVNHLEVHDAFQDLRLNGYDYQLKGMDIRISFWFSHTSDETRLAP